MTHHPVSLDHVRYLASTPVAAPPLPTPELQLVHLRDVTARALLQAGQRYITAAFIKRVKNSEATRRKYTTTASTSSFSLAVGVFESWGEF